MAELIISGQDLTIHLTIGEKIWSFHTDITVPLAAITSVAADPKPWVNLRGWRMAGINITGRASLGTRRHADGYDFCILHRSLPAVQMDMATGRFSRFLISVPPGGDAKAEAGRIAGAAGIKPS